MIYLKKYNSHNDYENDIENEHPYPYVAYDNEHVHFITSEEDEEEPTDTTTIVE